MVEVNQLGEVKAVAPAIEAYRPTDAQIAYHLARFIANVRSLSIDPIVVRQNWLDAYDYATDRGASVLNEYARANDPFKRVGQTSVAVETTSVVRASDNSFQIRWIERTYANGALATTERCRCAIDRTRRLRAMAACRRRCPPRVFRAWRVSGFLRARRDRRAPRFAGSRFLRVRARILEDERREVDRRSTARVFGTG